VSAPRVEIRLDRIHHNARALVARLAPRGIGVTGVTKATLGCTEVARVLLDAGVAALGESRIEGIEALRRAGVEARMVLLRSPMLSQVDRVVEHADASLNTELVVIDALGAAAVAQGRTHGVILMVELGDLREGILPADVEAVLGEVLGFEGIEVEGIGANLACQSGAAPDQRNMDELGALATALEARFGVHLPVVSGGNSANLDWALGGGTSGRINDLRLGEAILLGCEPLHRRPIEGLRTDAFTVVAEVIESKVKPTRPWGDIGQTAFGVARSGDVDPRTGSAGRALLAIGRQDVDPDGLAAPAGIAIVGASSDHLVVDTGEHLLGVGDEVRFQPGYGALLAAMTSPSVHKVILDGAEPVGSAGDGHGDLR
jgi:predicted amino acid racemase